MAAGAVINIVTGTPFSVTFNNGTNTFTIAGGNYTAMFNTGAILTALGGSPNGGYQQVTSSTFTGGNTVVTVSSYSIGTVYPGPATFTTGTGTVIWFQGGVAPPSGLVATPGNGIVTLSWTASPTPGVTYNVYQGTSPGGESGTPTVSGTSSTSALIFSLTNGTTYYYTVKAVSGAVISTASNEASATPNVPALATFQLSVGSFPSSTGPLGSPYGGDGEGFFDGSTNGGFSSAGSTTPSPITLNGNTIDACGWQGASTGFVFVVHATVAKNSFTTLDISAPINYSLTSASASTFDTTSFPGYSVWIWASKAGDEYTYQSDTATVNIY